MFYVDYVFLPKKKCLVYVFLKLIYILKIIKIRKTHLGLFDSYYLKTILMNNFFFFVDDLKLRSVENLFFVCFSCSLAWC